MRSLYLILLLGFVGCTSAQKKSDQSASQQLDVKEAVGYIDNFFAKYKAEGASKAIDYIFTTSRNPVETGPVKYKLDSLKGTLGAFTGYSLITEKDLGDGLVLFSYLVKHENHPIRFTFVFYKATDKWQLYKFLFDVEVEDELETSAKIYFIK